MAKLFIVATPIGNRADLSQRALEVLRGVAIIASESPRASTKLLTPLRLKGKVIPLIRNNKISISPVLKSLKLEKDVALISEAGTPGINDPGGAVVSQVRAAGYKVLPIPGANAAITAASVSGFPMDEFVFKGFVPHKKGRETFFKDISKIKSAVIFYESPHRFDKTRAALKKWFPERYVLVARELTKLHEQFWLGTPSQLVNLTQADLPIKGEFVVVLAPLNFVPRQKENNATG